MLTGDNHYYMHIPDLLHQKSYEQVRYVLRRHPLTFVPNAIMFIILLALPFGVAVMLKTQYPELLAGDVARTILILSASGYLLLVYIFFFFQFVDYYLDMWIVTNDRIIDIEQLGLFNRTISELDLFRIQDVTSEVKGIFATFFDYGNVSIKTASQNLDIVFHDIPHPNIIRKTLIDLANEDRKFHLTEVRDAGVNEN